MSERVFAFVEEWLSEHLHAERDPQAADATQAAALARQCIQDAQAAGIPQSEIDDAFDSLPDYIAGEIEEARERESGEPDDEDDGDAPDEDESEVPAQPGDPSGGRTR